MRSRDNNITIISLLEITFSRYFKTLQSLREATLSLDYTNTIDRFSMANYCKRKKSCALNKNRIYNLKHAYSWYLLSDNYFVAP
jgi:hypothetical protein